MKRNSISLIVVSMVLFSCGHPQAGKDSKDKDSLEIGKTPPMGWNSYDSYCIYLDEKQAMANVEAFAEKLKPYGYEYFVIDDGWFGEYELQEGTMIPTSFDAKKVNINEYGLLQPSNVFFPHGLKPIVERCHALGFKFGIHLLRGIPRQAVKQNTLVKETKYRAVDIVDTINVCDWSTINYGVDMNKPGAQEFYNSLVNQLADWGVDFIKYDDIVPYPKEIEAVENAIAQCGRPILLSLSPGDLVIDSAVDIYQKANMLRVTGDIWDNQQSIDATFDAMRKWQGNKFTNLWIDMDMIPFGQLQLTVPKPEGFDEATMDKYEVIEEQKTGKYQDMIILGGNGFHRWSKLSKDQMRTFITQRAISASPLMVSGDLLTMDRFSLELLTNKNMIDCNQNGVMGKLISDTDSIEVWKANQKDSQNSWIAIFNRKVLDKSVHLTNDLLGIDSGNSIVDIWNNVNIESGKDYVIEGNGVLFIKIEG